MRRLAAWVKWILLVPICIGLLGVDLRIATKALIARRIQAQSDAEYVRLNERFKAAKPKPVSFERSALDWF